MKLPETISKIVKEEIASKLYYRWDNDQVVAYILKRFPEIPESYKDEIHDLVIKTNEKVTLLRLGNKK